MGALAAGRLCRFNDAAAGALLRSAIPLRALRGSSPALIRPDRESNSEDQRSDLQKKDLLMRQRPP